MAGPFTSNVTREGSAKIVAGPLPTKYDIVTIGDFTFPGISKISVIKRTKKISIEKQKKGKGNRVVDSGINLAKIEIETRIFQDDELADMADIINFFENRLGLKQKSGDDTDGFPIYHPATRERGIRYVYVEDIEGPYYVQPPGYTQYKFSCIEVVKQKTTNSKTVVTSKELNLDSVQSALDVNNPVAPDKDPKNINP